MSGSDGEKTSITIVLEADAGIITPTESQVRATASELTRQLEGLYHSPFTITDVKIHAPRPEQGHRDSPEELDEVANLVAQGLLPVDLRPQNDEGEFLNKDGSVSKRQ